MEQANRILDQASLDRVAVVRALPKGAHVHVSGICGTGTAAVAALFKQLGYKVTGSDKAFYPPMGDVAKMIAAKLYTGYQASNLDAKPDLVVIGNSLSRGNPEVERVLEKNIPYASMPEVFSALLIGEREYCPTSVVVSGTHGKTTTSAMIAVMLDDAGRKPAYFIGGVLNDLWSGIRPIDPGTPVAERVVVLEGDEYDSAFFAKWAKFQSYRPDIAVVTSLEYDHADIYQNLEEIKLEFTRFLERVPKEGKILVCADAPGLKELGNKWQQSKMISAPVLFYGSAVDCDYRLVSRESVTGESQGQNLVLFLNDCELNTPVKFSGEHNALNYTVAAAVGELCGLSPEQISAGLEKFSGVRRRQQIIGDFNGVLLIEDFAHHPTAVKKTLEGLRESYPLRRVIAVFEPRSNTSRRSFFQQQYAEAFDCAHITLVKEAESGSGYSIDGKPQELLDTKKLVAEISARGSTALALSSVDEILEYLLKEKKTGDLIVLMSNGDFGGLLEKLKLSLAA